MVAGCAIPIAWKVLPSHAKGSWKAHWLRLLWSCKEIVPSTMNVLVLADRGRFARWLFQAIVGLGWHPYLRINLTAGDSLLTGHWKRAVPSVFVTGMLVLRMALFTGQLPLAAALQPRPWPDRPPDYRRKKTNVPP